MKFVSCKSFSLLSQDFSFLMYFFVCVFQLLSSGMKRTRLLLVLIGGIFFVAVISLYHMLELDFRIEKGLPGRHVDEV